ncbi:hypothetical protein [Microbacterium sp. MPKO10]|uniref:hypothetical protein n=1 Tax=Microbacterium sp. MPKO10 TaxID=2989818 RepID=UPI002235F98C|nr:hypothetical protein [Microbacterium sp. MPKO10]MCW4459733.1 hypothetical protein [Microbacterium sp. MPKO10]
METGAARAWDAVDASASSRAEVLAELNGRIRSMQKATLGAGAEAPVVPVVSELRDLFPGGGLRPGGVYEVLSPLLATMLLAEATRAGDWVAVVGMPDFSAAAAASAGVDIARVVVVPHPGGQGIRVSATLADVMSIVVLGEAADVGAGEAQRLEARLRRTGSVLLRLGEWAGAEDRLAVAERQWSGIRAGHGHLAACQVTATARGRAAAPRRVTFVLSEMSDARDGLEHSNE